MRLPILSVAAGLAYALLIASAPDTRAESNDEAVLARARVKPDSGSLLAYFRRRTLVARDAARLEDLVRQLGNDSYALRVQASDALEEAGPSALPFLRPAMKDADREIVRRAEHCVEVIERNAGPQVPLAAARLLAARKPAGAVQVLLDFLPSADDESVEDGVTEALTELGLQDGKAEPLILAALGDREPARRAAAAAIVGLAKDRDQYQQLTGLLADRVAKVRFQAARALAAKGEPASVPALIQLLADAPLELAWQSEEILGRLSGDKGPAVVLDNADAATRQKCRSAWEVWWQANQGRVDLAGLQSEARQMGLTLIADLDLGRISEVGPDRRERWHLDGFSGPVDCQLLPNGHLLVAENHANRVTERDKRGRVVWSKRVEEHVASCRRLANGLTFIAAYHHLLLVGTQGQESLNVFVPDGIYSGDRLRNGNFVVLTPRGSVVTLNPRGEKLKTFETGGINAWSSIEVLPNNHYLLCGSNGKVAELDEGGKPVWSLLIPNAVCAHRLSNGNTLVCDVEGKRVLETSTAGKTVWEYPTAGRPWHARRR